MVVDLSLCVNHLCNFFDTIWRRALYESIAVLRVSVDERAAAALFIDNTG